MSAIRRLQVVVEDEELIARQLVILAEHECGCVKVEILAAYGVRIPSETYAYLLESNADALAFLEYYCHVLNHVRIILGQMPSC